jgi:periplasmic protein TonB
MAASSRTPAAASKRLVAALAASALAHVLFTSALRPGSGLRDIAGLMLEPSTVPLVARLLVPDSAAPLPPATIEREPSAVPLPARKPHNVPRATPEMIKQLPKAETAGSADIPDATYYAARQLDIYPVLLSTLDASGAFTARGTRGRVVLLVSIDVSGNVEEVSILEAEPAGHFEEDARSAFKLARFQPAYRSGRAVKSRLVFHVEYGAGTP